MVDDRAGQSGGNLPGALGVGDDFRLGLTDGGHDEDVDRHPQEGATDDLDRGTLLEEGHKHGKALHPEEHSEEGPRGIERTVFLEPGACTNCLISCCNAR